MFRCDVMMQRRDAWAASAMNLLHFCWGLGSFLSPLVAKGVGLQAAAMTKTWFAIGLIGGLAGLPQLLMRPPPKLPDMKARAAGAAAGAAKKNRTPGIDSDDDDNNGDGEGGEGGGTTSINGGIAIKQHDDTADGEEGGEVAVASISDWKFGVGMFAMFM